MKKYIIAIAFPLFFFLFTSQTEAQVVQRHEARVEAGKPTVKITGQRARVRRRTRRRVRRRTHRRIARRTINRLPVGARAIRYRSTAYYPVNGFYFVKRNSAYVSVLPPVGFRVATIPWAYTRLTVAGKRYFYANGIYYVQIKNKYQITEPPVGAQIAELPEGYEETVIDGKTLYLYDDNLYKESKEGYELVGFVEDES
ncbi:MAG: DUF6515 family protein [Pricia sp.]